MNTETFRFAVVRPPKPVAGKDLANNSVFLSRESRLLNELRQAKAREARKDMIDLARTFIKSDSFINSAAKADPRFFVFADILTDQRTIDYAGYVRQNFDRIFGTDPASFIQSDLYTSTSRSVSDSIVAAAIDNGVTAKNKFILVQLTRALKAIYDLGHESPVTRLSIQSFRIVLPGEIFPLPLVDADLKEHRAGQIKKRKEAEAAGNKQRKELLAEIDQYNDAVNDLLDTFDKVTENSTARARSAAAAVSKTSGFVLTKDRLATLKNPVKETLKKAGLSVEELDVAKAIPILEKQAAAASRKLYSRPSVNKLVKIGNMIAPTFDFGELVLEADPFTRKPGMCPPSGLPGDINDDSKSLVTSGKHEVRVLGIADLMLVEQELARYELGEISHIENVLKSELRDRKHTVTQTTEETITTETEQKEVKEKDLSSVERFELQTESQKVINETTSIDAGVSVTASYGPVSSTANFNYANSNSLTDSQRSASNFARETTSKAVSKIETRTLERTQRRSLRQVEEINQHTFDNKEGEVNIAGIYRFVDKIYKAQIVNYGKRLMLEFIIPEPSAFLRFALTKQPYSSVNVALPEPPGYCLGNGKTFVPLAAQDIDRYNYMYWMSKYNVEDVQPPPTQTLVTSTSMISGVKELEMYDEGESKEFFNNKNISVDIPDGYRPVNADVVIDARLNLSDEVNDTAFVHLLIDKKTVDVNGHSQVSFANGTWQNVAIAMNTWNKVAYATVVNIFCRLTEEKEQKWKINTFNAIMNAYKDQKTKYDNAMEAERIRAGFSEIRGSNPLVNRETEKTELKKNCIAMLSGQRFDSFDAMNWNVGPEGYPEIDFEEAAAEGNFISFFEQAFEWNNMTYIFYPYFWANKKEWVSLSQLNDDDILYTRFLQAGSARVNIPVRTGFETSMLNYLDTNIIWPAEGSLVNTESGQPNPLHVSVVDELKSQLNNNSIDGLGRISVTRDSTVITGAGTEFLSGEDENKRIIIRGVTYIIKEVESSTALKLTTAYKGDTDTGLPYSYGAKLVGEPWEVRLPTNLVKLDSETNGLI